MDAPNFIPTPPAPPIQQPIVKPPRKWWKVILIIIGSIIVLLGAFLGIVFWNTSAPANTTRDFMNAISNRDVNTAYAMLDEEGKKAGDLKSFTTLVEQIFPDQPKIKEFKIEGRSFHVSTESNKTSKINGTAIFSDGKEFEFQTELIKVDGKWLVRGFDWQPAENNGQNNQPKNMNTYINKADGYQIDVPGDWVKTEFNDEQGSSIVELNKQVDGRSVGRMSFATSPLPDSATLDAIIESIDESYKQIFTGYNIIENKKISLNGLSAYSLEFTFDGPNGKIHDLAIFLAENGKNYAISAVIEDEQWQANKAIFRETLNSFKIIQ